MIIDTSALIAVLNKENGFEALREALVKGFGYIPAPVLVEFERVSALANNLPNPDGSELIAFLLSTGTKISPFSVEAAVAAAKANFAYGKGNGFGAKLNMLDLMVYGVAKVTDLPILFTGYDFAFTDALIHPASRVG